MASIKRTGKELFTYLDVPRKTLKEPVGDSILMAVEFMKYQGEIAYELGKKQAIAISSTSSTIGIGWSALFVGLLQESWLMSSVGLMMVLGATFLLAFWTPRMVDRARQTYEDIGAQKFYSKWLSHQGDTGDSEQEPAEGQGT